MKLYDLDGQTFELKIQGYQFLHILDDEFDSNWLMIHLAISSKEGSWSTTDPCLLVYEIEKLSEWLVAIGKNDKPSLIEFIEPNLKFEYRGKNLLRIYFHLESRPPWNSCGYVGDDDCFIELHMEKSKLIKAGKELEEEIKKFPARAIKKKDIKN